jgi:hypothetical protein
MGIREFFAQDANEAIDRLVAPYVRFMLRHSLINWLVFPLLVALIWIFVSKTVALVTIALAVILGLYGVAKVLRERLFSR